MNISSWAFENGGDIPSKYTCEGENLIPPLEIKDVPEETVALVLIMDDPDIPDFVREQRGIEVFDHWVIFNIQPATDNQLQIKEGEEPEGVRGLNSLGKLGYHGPCPPDREHRYFFKLYALDKKLNLPEGTNKAEVERVMKSNVVEQAELMGRYEKKEKN